MREERHAELLKAAKPKAEKIAEVKKLVANSVTAAAMKEAETAELPKFASVDELMVDLNAPDGDGMVKMKKLKKLKKLVERKGKKTK